MELFLQLKIMLAANYHLVAQIEFSVFQSSAFNLSYFVNIYDLR
jgi:hypothetical protein